jgi:hypothetical protein
VPSWFQWRHGRGCQYTPAISRPVPCHVSHIYRARLSGFAGHCHETRHPSHSPMLARRSRAGSGGYRTEHRHLIRQIPAFGNAARDTTKGQRETHTAWSRLPTRSCSGHSPPICSRCSRSRSCCSSCSESRRHKTQNSDSPPGRVLFGRVQKTGWVFFGRGQKTGQNISSTSMNPCLYPRSLCQSPPSFGSTLVAGTSFGGLLSVTSSKM